MRGGNLTPAMARTGTPITAGAVIIALARWLFGVELTVDQVLVILPIVQGAYYMLGRGLEAWKPAWGYVLGIPKQPAYSQEKAPSPRGDEEVVAEVIHEEPGT